MKRLLIPVLVLAAMLSLTACATTHSPSTVDTVAVHTAAVHAAIPVAPANPAAPTGSDVVLCPACKIIIDYGALQSASADSEKSAYAQWETVLAGLESGAWTWEEVGPLAYDVCEWADEIRARTAKLEKALRELAERKPK